MAEHQQDRPPRRWLRQVRRRVNRLAAVGTLAAVVGTGALAAAPSASAADPHRVGPGVEITGVTQVGSTFLGAVGAPNGVNALVWCLQAGLWSPVGTDILAESIIADAELAWIIGQYQNVETDQSRAAIAYLVHVRHDEGSNGVSAADRRAAVEANTPADVKALAAQYLAEAATAAGPYAGQAGAAEYTQAQRTGRINGIGLQSASGTWTAGKSFVVTLNGPAVFDATGTNTYSGTTESGPISLGWTATGNGEVTYNLKVQGLGRTTLTKLGTNGDVQDVLTYGNRPPADPEEITTPGTPFDVVLDFRIQGTTQVQADVVKKGDPLIDTLRVQAHPEDVWAPGANGDEYVDMVGKLTWYGPFSVPQAQQDTVPAGAPVAGVETFTATGPGEYISPGTVTAPGDGFYTAVLAFSKADQGPNATYLREDWSAPFFEEVETSVVKAVVKHRSMAREYNVAPGGGAFDTITIDALPADHTTFAGLGKWAADTMTADVRVYGPFESAPSTPEVPEGAPVFYETTVEAINGTFDIGYDPADPITLPSSVTYPTGDHYVFVYHLAEDSRVEEYTSPFNDVRERFYVPGPQAPVEEPTVVTQAQPTAKVGEEFEDVALVTGKTEDGDYLTFEAYGPRDPAAAPTCDADPVWTSEQIPVTGQGYYSSGKTTVSTAGAVDWVETLHGADGTVKHRGECGAPGETTLITEGPSVTTKATSDNGDKPVVGDDIWDTIETSGNFPAGSTIVVDLFYAAPGQELTCEAKPIWTSDEIAITDGVTSYVTGKYTTDKAGTYGFVERTIGPDGSIIVEGVCGLANETLVVTTPPTIPPTIPTPSDAGGTAADGGRLATTGASVLAVVIGALALIGVGAGIMVSRRRAARLSA